MTVPLLLSARSDVLTAADVDLISELQGPLGGYITFSY